MSSAVINLVNAVGGSAFAAVSGFISLNYVVGEAIFSAVSLVASVIISVVVNIAKAVEIILEDLLAFLR